MLQEVFSACPINDSEMSSNIYWSVTKFNFNAGTIRGIACTLTQSTKVISAINIQVLYLQDGDGQ